MSPEFPCHRNFHRNSRELGHQFGWIPEGPEGTLMNQGALPTAKFNEDQIKCFRNSEEIEK